MGDFAKAFAGYTETPYGWVDDTAPVQRNTNNTIKPVRMTEFRMDDEFTVIPTPKGSAYSNWSDAEKIKISEFFGDYAPYLRNTVYNYDDSSATLFFSDDTRFQIADYVNKELTHCDALVFDHAKWVQLITDVQQYISEHKIKG